MHKFKPFIQDNSDVIIRVLISMLMFLFILVLIFIDFNRPNSSNQLILNPTISTKSLQQFSKTYGQIPMHFEENNGQFNDSVKFMSKGIGYTLFLTENEALFLFQNRTSRSKMYDGKYNLDSDVKNEFTSMSIKLDNANIPNTLKGVDQLESISNYFIGNDKSKWRSDIPNYKKVYYSEVYSGIDLVYYGNQKQLEYDFIVTPFSDPKQISLSIEGADSKVIDGDGNLLLNKNGNQVVFDAPIVYQNINGNKNLVEASYTNLDDESIGFDLGEYNPEYKLTIDPKLIYATYLGGSETDYGWDIAVDTLGNVYVVGETSSTDFPTKNPIANQPIGGDSSGRNVFVSKLNPDGDGLIYSTIIGGNDSDEGVAIKVDLDGNAYITGPTSSPDFPTVNAYDPTFTPFSRDGFVAKINPQGNGLIFSTYLGGGYLDWPYAIDIDEENNVYVGGYTASIDFPTLNPYQEFPGDFYYTSDTSSHGNIFITKFNPQGNGLIFSTYIGGKWDEHCHDIAVDSAGNVYLTGYAISPDYPLVNPFQSEFISDHPGWWMAIVSKLDSTGSNLIYSTYLGGDGQDAGWDIAIDDLGNAYVVGGTASSNFPTLNAIQESPFEPGFLNGAGFITKFNPEGNSIAYSSYLTGTDHQTTCYGVAVADDYWVYISGINHASDFEILDPISPGDQHPGAFIYLIDPTGQEIAYSTSLTSVSSYEGQEIAIDRYGDMYIAGSIGEWSKRFPTLSPFQANQAGKGDAYVAKIGIVDDDILITDIIPNPYSVHPDSFWIESTLRPGEKWKFTTDFAYNLVSADSGKVKMQLETYSGKILAESITSVKRGVNREKKKFASPEVIIPDVKLDEIDTLYIKLKLIPDGFADHTASDSISYRIFRHKWTFMVYLDGDNDLEEFSLYDFEELWIEPSNDSIAVVMLYDRHPGYVGWWFDQKTGEWREELGWADTRRIFDHRGFYLEESVGELNMGDPATLRNFVLWSMEKFPAQHYALVLWDHGGGWKKVAPRGSESDLKKLITGNSNHELQKFLIQPNFPDMAPDGRNGRNDYKDVIVDETDNDVLYSSEIRMALAGLPRLDILAFDACLMNMVENAYQYRQLADYMVGSEATEPGDGWPYDPILARLHDRPHMNAVELSHIIVDEYGYSYPPDGWDITQSAINLWEMEGVAKALNELSTVLIENRRWGEITSALKQTRYMWPLKQYRDIYHFTNLLSNITSNQSTQEACNKLISALDRAIIANYHSSAEDNYNGLAIFFPNVISQYDASYDRIDNIKLSDDTQWDEFLRLYLSRGLYVDTYEPNNALSQAYGPIFPKTDYFSYFPHAGDKDYYFFTTGMSTNLSVLLTSQGINWDIAVYDFNGTLLGQTNKITSIDTLIFTNLPPSSYYIEIISNEISLPEIPYKLEVDYQGSNTGKFLLSSDDAVPDSELYSDKSGDVIGMQFHAPTYPIQLEEVSFYIESIDGSGSGGDGSFYLWLADYYGMILDPVLVTPDPGSMNKNTQSANWFTVPLADSAINLQSDFIIGIGYDGTNTPALGIDTSDNGRTFKWDSQIKKWLSLDVSAFIRTKVSYPEKLNRVRISFPAEIQAEAKNVITVPVEISNLPPGGIDSLELEIFYDHLALRLTNLDHQNTLTSDWNLDKMIFGAAGRITVKMSGNTKISSVGDLMNFKFFVENTVVTDTVKVTINHAILNGGDYFVETKSADIIISPSTGVEEKVDLPTKFSLEQNYPNPFNPVTTIKYSIPKQSNVTLKLFNILGKEIRTLIDKVHSPGIYKIQFDGVDLTSGIYFYRIQAGDFAETKKMILIK